MTDGVYGGYRRYQGEGQGEEYFFHSISVAFKRKKHRNAQTEGRINAYQDMKRCREPREEKHGPVSPVRQGDKRPERADIGEALRLDAAEHPPARDDGLKGDKEYKGRNNEREMNFERPDDFFDDDREEEVEYKPSCYRDQVQWQYSGKLTKYRIEEKSIADVLIQKPVAGDPRRIAEVSCLGEYHIFVYTEDILKKKIEDKDDEDGQENGALPDEFPEGTACVDECATMAPRIQ